VFDLNKLFWINRHYLKECERGRLLELTIPFLQQAGLLSGVDEAIREWATQVIEALLPGVDHVSQIPARAAFIFDFNPTEAMKSEAVQHVLAEAKAADVIRLLAGELAKPGRELPRDWKEVVSTVKAQSGQKGKPLFHPIRVALTGSDSGPELDKLLPIFENGNRLSLPKPVLSCRQRTAAFAALITSN
jgi:glutamyl-tRNA synthetase/nondiscriminating glutamyl-tRNA synthetase